MISRPSRVTLAIGLFIALSGCSREKFGGILPKEAEKYVLAPASRRAFPVRVLTAEGQVDDPQAVLALDGRATRITSQGGSPSRIILDFGREVGGFLSVKFEGSTSPLLSFAFSESPDYLEPTGDLASAAFSGPPELHYHRPGPGPEEWTDPAIRGGFRYLIITVEGSGRADLDALWCDSASFLGTPSTYRGYFLSDDDLLNRAWFAGAYTVEMCTIDSRTGTPGGKARLSSAPSVIVDGPKRDRVVWSGDLISSAPVLLLSHDRPEIVRDTLASLADNQRDDGYIPAASAAGAGLLAATFGEYTAWWVILARLYDLYVGDRDFLERYWPRIVRAMEYLKAQEGPNGLFLQSSANGLEWCYSILRDGEPTYTNALYYKALMDASALAAEMGDTGLTLTYSDKAGTVKAAVLQTLWNSSTGAFADTSLDFVHTPQDGNSLAVLYGIVDDPAQRASILTYLHDTMWVSWGSTNVDVPYQQVLLDVPFHNKRVVPFMNYFEVMARFQAGDDAGAFDLMKRCWGNMLGAADPQTFWEFVGPSGRPESPFVSLSHGWSAGITAILTTQVLGVEPLAPGFSRYRVTPRLGPLSWAEGRVPTPHGGIFVRVERSGDGVTASILSPEGTEGSLRVPGARDSILISPGRSVVNTHLVTPWPRGGSFP